MDWATPQHSKGEVDRAGVAFVDSGTSAGDRAEARAIINNWRSSHSFPLNTLQVSLRNKARGVDPNALIAQRIKRLPSIRGKLERYPEMKLSRMQDLGGARAVLPDVDSVREVEAAFRSSRHKHVLRRHDDYIGAPKPSGYRGVHLVYRYQSDRSSTYNGLHIEVQVRSQLQHSWATAVETVGTFTKQSLKSSRGQEDWLRFFTLMGSHFARLENSPLVPGTPVDWDEHCSELISLANQLQVLDRLTAYGHALRQQDNASGQDKFFLLQLDISNSLLTIQSFRNLEGASAAFDAVEQFSAEAADAEVMHDAVLVSVDSLTSLQKAYPNYFLDTSVFLDHLRSLAADRLQAN